MDTGQAGWLWCDPSAAMDAGKDDGRRHTALRWRRQPPGDRRTPSLNASRTCPAPGVPV